MDKSEIIEKLQNLFTYPQSKLWEKVKGSRANISKWWNEEDRSSDRIEKAALELIKEGEEAHKALQAIGQPMKL